MAADYERVVLYMLQEKEKNFNGIFISGRLKPNYKVDTCGRASS